MNTTSQLCARCNLCEIGDDVVCDSCSRFYPPSLLKAASDFFDYALRLSSGEIIRFRSADIHGDYVTLYGGDGSHCSGSLADCGQDPALPFIFDRGLDVRLSEIVW